MTKEEVKNIVNLKEISKKILFGNENPEIIVQEIMEGKRPSSRNTPGHPDHTVWTHLLAERKNLDI